MPMTSAGGAFAFVPVLVQFGASGCITGKDGSRPSLMPAAPTTVLERGALSVESGLPNSPRARASPAASVESLYPDLQDAVLGADVLGTPEAHLRAALEYWKLGTDLVGLGDFCPAAKQFQAALALDAEAQFARSNLAVICDRCDASELDRRQP